MEQQEYNKLVDDVKYKIMDLLDKVTDDYIDGFVESVDCEIKNIKENNKFWQNEYYQYCNALKYACEEILKLQGFSKIADDFIDKRIELENQFLNQVKKVE